MRSAPRRALPRPLPLHPAARGAARQLKGDHDGALADYNQAIKLAPRFAKAWFSRGIFWKARGDLRQAEADFTQAIELSPYLADVYIHRGLERMMQGRADEAQQDFDRCLAPNKNLKESLERLIIEAKRQFEKKQ